MGDEEVLESESTSSEEATSEETTSEPSKIKIDFGGKSREYDPEVFAKIADAVEKGQKWETSYHKKGETLNRERATIMAERKEIEENKKLLNEYREIKKAIEANPAAYSAMQKALNEQQSAIPPAYKDLENKTRELEQTMAYDRALRDVTREYEDFDENTIRNFSLEYDVNNPKDMLSLYYNAWKGSQLSDLIEKAKGEVVLAAKNKKGLPPVGTKTVPKAEMPKSLREQYEAAKKRIQEEGALF